MLLPKSNIIKSAKGCSWTALCQKVLLGSTMLLPKSNVTKRTTPKSTITKGCSWGALCQKVLLGSTMLLPKNNITKRTIPKSTITKGCFWGVFCQKVLLGSTMLLPKSNVTKRTTPVLLGSTLPKDALGERNVTTQEQHPTVHDFTMRCVTYLYDNILIVKNKHLHFAPYMRLFFYNK